MTRFGDGGDDYYPGAEYLWEANLARAMSGKRGQQTLRDLETALLELPQPRLIEGRVAEKGEVCAVGALAVKRRVDKGENRADVLAQLERAYDPDDDSDGTETAYLGKSVGVTFNLAWQIGYLNDETFSGLDPETRYQRVLEWVRARILPTPEPFTATPRILVRRLPGLPVPDRPDSGVSGSSASLFDALNRLAELHELLADLAMEGKIVGLGDPVAEANDQTGVLGRVRSALGREFLDS